MPQYPSGTVAFLVTDIEGSTKCWEGESATMLVAFERHFTVLAGAIAAQNGVLFKAISNAVQVMFPIAQSLRAEDWIDLSPARTSLGDGAQKSLLVYKGSSTRSDCFTG